MDRFDELKARVEHELARVTLSWQHPVSRVWLDLANDIALATRERNGGHTAYAMHILASVEEFLSDYRMEVRHEEDHQLDQTQAWY